MADSAVYIQNVGYALECEKWYADGQNDFRNIQIQSKHTATVGKRKSQVFKNKQYAKIDAQHGDNEHFYARSVLPIVVNGQSEIVIGDNWTDHDQYEPGFSICIEKQTRKKQDNIAGLYFPSA